MKELYQNVFENSKEATIIIEKESDRIIDANIAACCLYGYSKNEFLKLKGNNLLAIPEEKSNVTKESFTYHCKKNGTKFPVDISTYSFNLEKQTHICMMTKDITSSYNLSIKETPALLKTLIDRSPVAIIFLDNNDNVQIWNHSAQIIFGWTAEEVLGKPNPIIPAEKLSEYKETSPEVFKHDEITGQEMFRQRKDGTRILVNLSSSVVLDQKSEVLGRMAIIENITLRKQNDAWATQNEAFFSAFLENSPLYIFFKDENNKVLRLSRNFEQMLGIKAEDAFGKTMDELFPQEMAENMIADDRKVMSEGKRLDVIEDLNGRTFVTTKFPIFRNGKPYMLAGFTQDITEQKRLTEQLEMLKISIDVHFDGAYWFDTDNHFVYINEAGCTMLRYTREELLNMQLSDVNPSASPEKMEIVWNKLRIDKYYVSETTHRRKDGSEFPVEISSTYVKFGNKEYNCGFARDITERKKVERELQISEARLLSLIQNRRESIWTIDQDLRYVILNDMFKKSYMVAYQVELKPGMLVKESISPKLIPVWIPKYEAALCGEIVEFEFSETLLGEIHYFSVNITPILVENRVIGASVISIDISNRKRGEEALQQSEEKFRMMAEQMVDVLFTTNMEGIITYLSPSTKKIFGMTPEEMMGNHFTEFLDDNEKNKGLSAFQNDIQDKGPSQDLLLNMRRKNGSVFPGEINASPIKNRDGIIIGTMGLIRNISEKIAFEEAIKHERNQLRTLIDNLPDLIFFKDSEGKYLLNNLAHLHSLGKEKPEDVFYKSMEDVHPKELADSYWNDELVIIKSGIPLLNKEELAFNHEKNEHRWHLTNKYPIKDSNGKVTGIIGISRDITDRKKAEETLRASEEKYRLLFENMTAGFALHEMLFDEDENPTDYKFLEVNPFFEKITGLKASHILGKKVTEVLPNVEQYWINFYGNVAKTGIATSYQNYAQDLKRHYDVWVFSPKIGQFATIITDITKQKIIEEEIKLQNEEYQSLNQEYIALNEELIDSNNRLVKINQDLEKARQKAEESDNLKSAFLCNMSHEIRTPMNAILGFSEIITQPAIPESKKQHFSKLIKERTYDLLRIIEDILDISKIEIGQMSLIESEININTLLIELLELYLMRKKSQKPDSNINISLKTEKNIPNPTIIVDSSRLRQILMNLLDNSLKFTQEGSIEMRCALKDNSLLFSVSDTGIGIPPDKKEIVFDRFRQAEDLHTRRHFGGTGLGLSIAKGLTELMGGKIWLESELNVGTRFFVTIPYNPVATNNKDSTGNQLQINNHWGNKNILIVEDDESSATLINEIMYPTKANILNAYCGKEAIILFEKNEINLVLLDIRLPDTNGLSVAKSMKTMKSNVPILAQTAYATEADAKACAEAGCDAYISKPISPEKLLALIQQFFE